MAPTVVDLCCGLGGLGLGFHRAGFDVALAVDDRRAACATYARAVPDAEVRRMDVRELAPGDVPEADVVVGGPPQAPFSPENRDRRSDPTARLMEDPAGSLTLRVLLHVKDLQPEAFVMAHHPAVLDGPLRGELERVLDRAGYRSVRFPVLEAADHGAPCAREVLVASNVDVDPEPADADPPTVWDLIGDLEPLGADVPNHEDFPLRFERRERVAELEPGEALYTWTDADGVERTSWRRLRRDDVAPRVTGNRRFVHPTQPRLLTVREHARLVGLPDELVVEGELQERYQLVGEAVPPALAEAVAREVLAAVDA